MQDEMYWTHITAAVIVFSVWMTVIEIAAWLCFRRKKK